MATKKAAPKKAVTVVKSPKKAAVKTAVSSKTIARLTSKKSGPAKKVAVKQVVTAPAKAGKSVAPAKKASKLASLPSRKSVAPVVKKSGAPPKLPAPVVPAPASKPEPVKKPAVAAPSHQEVKPAIKPLVKSVAKKEAPAKPFVVPKTSTDKAVKYEPDFTKSVLDKKTNASSSSITKEQTGPTMRYPDSELTEFRELIMKKLDTAKKELAYLQGLITRKDESGDLDEGRYMTMEDGSMSMEREQLSQMASRQIQFIDHLEKAIMRIENKTYGICRVTGNLIDKARLRAVPHATLSIEAKQMMNK